MEHVCHYNGHYYYFDFEHPICYKCGLIQRVLQIQLVEKGKVIAERDTQFYESHWEDLLIIVQFLGLGLLMSLGSKFNQISYRLWGINFILLANIKWLRYIKSSLELLYLISVLNPMVILTADDDNRSHYFKTIYQILYVQSDTIWNDGFMVLL